MQGLEDRVCRAWRIEYAGQILWRIEYAGQILWRIEYAGQIPWRIEYAGQMYRVCRQKDTGQAISN